MAITCLLLQPGQNFTATPTTNSSTLEEDHSPSRACDEEALSMGDYRDILSLIRVLSHGPQSKSDVDGIVELYVINQISFENFLSLLTTLLMISFLLYWHFIGVLVQDI